MRRIRLIIHGIRRGARILKRLRYQHLYLTTTSLLLRCSRCSYRHTLMLGLLLLLISLTVHFIWKTCNTASNSWSTEGILLCLELLMMLLKLVKLIELLLGWVAIDCFHLRLRRFRLNVSICSTDAKDHIIRVSDLLINDHILLDIGHILCMLRSMRLMVRFNKLLRSVWIANWVWLRATLFVLIDKHTKYLLIV